MTEPTSTVLQLVAQLQPALAKFNRARLAEIIAGLVELRAPMGDQWRQLSQVAAGIGEITLARRSADLLAEAFGNSPAALYQKASLLAHLGDVAGALAVVESLPADAPDPVSNAYSRANALLNLGQVGEARPLLDQVVAARPELAPAWLMMAMSTDLRQDPALAERIRTAERHVQGATPAQQAPYYYALGKTYADLGEHPRAFEAYSHGAELTRSFVTYDRHRDRAEAAEAVFGYNAERIAEIARQQSQPTGRAIIATGLPRSGTTLVQQILTSHSAVGGGGELNRLALFGFDFGGTGYPSLAKWVVDHGADAPARLWDHWLSELYPPGMRAVDKSIDGSRNLGMAASLLPDAPLVWIKRDPLDCAWSCFRTNFVGAALPWSYDLEDIAFHFRLEDELRGQWRTILGDRLLVIAYEDLVACPEREIPRLLAHCGLSEEPQVYAPHENRGAVATASMAQVRKPIHREAVGSAEPYLEYLAPFVSAYEG